jgi:hypothetical protein
MSDAVEGAVAGEVPAQGKATANDPVIEVSRELANQVRDALRLLEHAVESGFKRSDGTTVAHATISAIKTTAALAGVTDTTPRDKDGEDSAELRTSQWIAFEVAYRDLATVMSPVTAESLRNTEAIGTWLFVRMSPAQSFTRWLWMVAIGFAVFVILGEWGMQRYGPVQEGEVDWQNTLLQLFVILVPYGYGGLGACAYLLRSAHQYIYERTFDLRRKPEYFSRVLLGAISGGAIILFVDHVQTDDEEAITLSAAALGFLAGYSTDFLFNTIERVVGAILPKVGIETVRRAKDSPSRPVASVDTAGAGLKEMLDRLDAATTDDDKKLYRSIVERMRDRL